MKGLGVCQRYELVLFIFTLSWIPDGQVSCNIMWDSFEQSAEINRMEFNKEKSMKNENHKYRMVKM